MTGRNGKGGRGGRGGRGGNKGGQGSGYTGSSKSKKQGMCSALGEHVFDYGQKGSADQTRMTWEKIIQYVGTQYGHNISNELQNKTTVTLQEPEYDLAIRTRHEEFTRMKQAGFTRLLVAEQARLTAVEGAITDAGANPPAALICEQAQVTNTIAELEFNQTQPIPMKLSEEEKTAHNNKWRTHRERIAKLETHRGQAYSPAVSRTRSATNDLSKPACFILVKSS